MFQVFEKSCEHYIEAISILFDTVEEARSFIEVMKLGMYYKDMHPEYELLIYQKVE